MDKPISVGDLVYVARGNKCCGAWAGSIFRVSEINFVTTGLWHCRSCGATGEIASVQVACAKGHPKFQGGMPLSRLRRIPPAGELGIVDEKEELHA